MKYSLSKLAIDGGTPIRERPFAPWPIWDEKEEKALIRALHSGQWGMGGEEIESLESEFSQAIGVRHSFAVPTGSAALEVALFAAGVGYGDEVIVPPYTFFATASACLMRGAIPVFADIDPETYCLDSASVEKAITDRTRAIIPVHIGGCPADMTGLMEVARRHGLFVIEDACQAHGASWMGQQVGGIGHLGCFSFQSSKNINCGEGGMVTTNDDRLAEKCWSFKNYGRSPEKQRYYHANLGTNFRLSQFQAAVLRAQLTRMEDWATRRAANGDFLASTLEASQGLLPQKKQREVTRHAYHLFITRYNPEHFGNWSREKFIEAMAAEGIPAAACWPPLHHVAGITGPTRELKSALGLLKEDDSPAHCPHAEKAGGFESVWLIGQQALVGEEEDMLDVLRATEKIQHFAKANPA